MNEKSSKFPEKTLALLHKPPPAPILTAAPLFDGGQAKIHHSRSRQRQGVLCQKHNNLGRERAAVRTKRERTHIIQLLTPKKTHRSCPSDGHVYPLNGPTFRAERTERKAKFLIYAERNEKKIRPTQDYNLNLFFLLGRRLETWSAKEGETRQCSPPTDEHRDETNARELPSVQFPGSILFRGFEYRNMYTPKQPLRTPCLRTCPIAHQKEHPP